LFHRRSIHKLDQNTAIEKVKRLNPDGAKVIDLQKIRLPSLDLKEEYPFKNSVEFTTFPFREKYERKPRNF